MQSFVVVWTLSRGALVRPEPLDTKTCHQIAIVEAAAEAKRNPQWAIDMPELLRTEASHV